MSYDYTKDETPFDANPPEDIDYEIAGDLETSNTSADEIEQEGGFKPIPVGDGHELVVVGFLTPKGQNTPISNAHVDCFFGDRRDSYSRDSVTVKLALVSDRACQTLDTFVLPPNNPHDRKCYHEATAKINDRAGMRGFDSKRTYQFMERLGYVWPKGGPLPPEACKLKNWIGRKILADVEMSKPYSKKVRNKDTGLEEDKVYPAKPKLRLFSYRLHPETVEQYRRASELMPKGNNGGSVNSGRPAPSPAVAGQPKPVSASRKAPIDI